MTIEANVDKALIRDYVVATSNTVAQGVPVMLSSGYIVECNTDDDLAIGVAYTSEDGTWPAGAGDHVGVVLRGSPAIVPVRSTSAGITAGAMVAPGASGVVDVTVGGGTVITNVIGQALETATADGELVGCNLGCSCTTVTAS